MAENEKPKQTHRDVLLPGQTPPAQKFDSPPLGAPAQSAKGSISPETASTLAGMTREQRDDFFRTLLKTAKPEEIIRTYGVSESYLAVIADDEE